MTAVQLLYMAVVFLLYGEENVGKTTLCKQIHDLFSSIPGSIIEEFHPLKDGDFKSKIRLPAFSISIYSSGDDQETLNADVEWATYANCDYHIGVVRKNTEYGKHVDKLGIDNKIIWINL